MTERTLTLNGKKIKFKASAALPRMYRTMFGRDAFKDMETVEKAILTARQENNEEQGIPGDTLELLENIAYSMAKHADSKVPDTVEEWLEQFEVLSIYSIIPIIPDLWYANMKTSIPSKKKSDPQTGK